jgi:cobalt-zinc-cadmium resistance protein CzcA
MAGIPDMKNLRSFSLAGISSIMMNFNDDSDNSWNRERVLERLGTVTLPAGLVPQLQTDWSPVGQIYWYTIESKNPNIDVMEQKSIEDWTLVKQFKSVPGVVDVASFGGATKEYQIRLDPDKLIAYGLSIGQIEQQLATTTPTRAAASSWPGRSRSTCRPQGLYQNVQQIEDTWSRPRPAPRCASKTSPWSIRGPRSAWARSPRPTSRSRDGEERTAS